MAPRLCKFKCGTMLDGFDEDARKYLEATTGGFHTKERCEEAKAKLGSKKSDPMSTLSHDREDKDDHGNEETVGIDFNKLTSTNSKGQYVDHTAKGLSKVKIFFSTFVEEVEKDYNDFCAQKGIKGQGAHDHVTKLNASEDGGVMQYTIYLYYEEVEK